MEYLDGHFQTDKIAKLTEFARFIGRYDIISLKNEIKTNNGNTLVQAERTITEKFMKSLLTRDDLVIDQFIIKNTENLKAAIASKITKEFEAKLDLAEFSFCAYLLNKKPLDIRRIVRTTLNNKFFLGYVTNQFFNETHIVEHLTEIALTSLGLINSISKDVTYSDFSNIFMAAFLHDYSIGDDKNWETFDDFAALHDHDKDSAAAVSDKELPSIVPEIILTNNKLRITFQGNDNEQWYANNTELSSTILNLAEYFSFLKREANRDKPESDEMPIVIYQLSLATEKGYFPKHLVGVFENHYSKYNFYFQYGARIGAIEAKCILNDLARAYPKPKATQLLCKDSSEECVHRIISQPLKVVSDKITKDKIFEQLNSGWYDKCNFSDSLPNPPEKF